MPKDAKEICTFTFKQEGFKVRCYYFVVLIEFQTASGLPDKCYRQLKWPEFLTKDSVAMFPTPDPEAKRVMKKLEEGQ